MYALSNFVTGGTAVIGLLVVRVCIRHCNLTSAILCHQPHKDFVADRKATVPLVGLQHSCTNHLASFTLIIHVLFTRLRHHQTCTYMRTTNHYSVFKYKFASFRFYISCFRVSRNDALQYSVLTVRYMAVNFTIEFQAIHGTVHRE